MNLASLLTEPYVTRFWSSVEKIPFHTCWEWIGEVNRTDGYGRFCPQYRLNSLAHRVSWMFVNGPIPRGLFVLHKCDNRSCVRPEHLFLGDAGANYYDALGKGRMPKPVAAARNAAKTHCFAGHPFTPENTYVSHPQKKMGIGILRQCRVCVNERRRERRRGIYRRPR